MRQVIQQNPALLPALLQQLGQENPQLLQVQPWVAEGVSAGTVSLPLWVPQPQVVILAQHGT